MNYELRIVDNILFSKKRFLHSEKGICIFEF